MSADNSETHSTDFKVKHLEAHGHRIILNDAARLLIVDDHMLPCTPTEYYLFTALLRSPYLPSARLIEIVWQQPMNRNLRRMLGLHISRLRGKTWAAGLDITCLHTRGYMLVPWTEVTIQKS